MSFLESQDVRVTAQGPASLAFQAAEAGGATFEAAVCAAGMYLVHVEVDGHPLSGWPKPLHVTAAASKASRSAFPALPSDVMSMSLPRTDRQDASLPGRRCYTSFGAVNATARLYVVSDCIACSIRG